MLKGPVRPTACALLFACAALPVQAAPVQTQPRLAVIGFEGTGVEESSLAALEDVVAQVASQLTTMDIVSASDLRAVLNMTQMQQLAGCSDGACMTEFGDLLSVQQMIAGSVRPVGSKLSINLQLMDLVNGRVLQRASEEVDEDTESLFAAVRRNVAVLFGVVGQIRVWNQPQGAELFLDGGLVGTTPVDVVTVRTPGQHDVAILGPGLVPWRENVEVAAGADLRLRATSASFDTLLAEADGRRSTAYWLGGGSVLAAVGAGFLWAMAVSNDQRLDRIDRRAASQQELDEITNRTATLALSSGLVGAIAAALGGTALYIGFNNPAADTLAEHRAAE